MTCFTVVSTANNVVLTVDSKLFVVGHIEKSMDCAAAVPVHDASSATAVQIRCMARAVLHLSCSVHGTRFVAAILFGAA